MALPVADRIEAARQAVRRMRVPQSPFVQRPPGPDRGDAVRLLTRRTPPYVFFQDMCRDHWPIGHVHLLGEHVYCLATPELIWEAFVTNGRRTIKGRALQLTRPLLGNGLLTSEGAAHLRNRRLVQPAFHHKRIADYSLVMSDAAESLAGRWLTESVGEIDVVEQMSALTLEIVGRTLFGSDLSGDADEVGRALAEVLAGFTRINGPLIPSLTRIPTPQRRRMIDSVTRLDRVVDTMIAARRDALAAGHPGDDVLSVLMRTTDPDTGESLTDDEVRDESMTLVLAGHETTAMALSWALRDVTMNPSVRAWLHEEIDSLPARALSMADLASLPRTQAVVAESMRLHPPAWILGRHAGTDMELGGWLVPAGSVLLASQYALHRDPRWWEQADRFVPSRWLSAEGRFDEKAPGQPKGSWFPFGFGARRCIGEQFAWVEATIVLATLLRAWDIAVIAPESTVPMAAVTLRPVGMRATLTARVAAGAAS